MLELDKLNSEITKLNSNLDGITDDLVSSVEKYQSEYERLLLKTPFDLDDGNLKSTMANFNKAQSLNPMSKLGFNALDANHIKEYNNVTKGQLAFNKSIGITTDLNYTDITIVKQLKNIDYSVFQAEALLLDERIKRELVNAIALGTPYDQVVENLSASLLGSGEKNGALARFADTYMRTALFGLSRTVDQEIYDKVGGLEPTALYLYAGPVDKRTRPFCMRHINKVYSRAKIEQFPSENGSGLNAFMSPGGWNCRHYMVLISEEDAKDAGYQIIR